MKTRFERTDFASAPQASISPSPLDTEGRNEQIERFFNDVKHFGITEIRERVSLASSKKCMQEHRYAKDRSSDYKLYYIMQ